MSLAVLSDLVSIERDIGQYFDYYYDPSDNHLGSDEFARMCAVPPGLKTLVTDLHELGDASKDVTEVVAALIMAENKHAEWETLQYANAHPDDVEAEIYRNLKRARTVAKTAIEQLLVQFAVR